MNRADSFLPANFPLPTLRIHTARRQAYVRHGGKQHYLGRPGAPETLQRYRAFCAELVATGRPPATAPRGNDDPARGTVGQLVEAFEEDRKRRGLPRDGYLDLAMTALREAHGWEPVADFGPKKLKALMAVWAARNLSRSTVNPAAQAVKRIFRWGCSEQLVEVAAWQALTSVSGLRAGESPAAEPRRVLPVPDDVVNATLAHLPRTLAAVVELLRLTGARPSELLGLTPAMVDRSGDVWKAEIFEHKSAHRGRRRTLYFGPRAQAVLLPFLLRDGAAPCFDPREAMRQRHEGKTGRGPWRAPNPKKTDRELNDRYDADGLRRAIKRAAAAAGVAAWHPYQLRHTAATKARTAAGLDAAQVLLGHASADVTQVYAELDTTKAMELARRIG
ncbi:MAG: site-specific integrase [Candidatus Hydrogenedentes bacterium]|nr:site-specific integrase [Candidatus Hydrogenedentota bacterium]